VTTTGPTWREQAIARSLDTARARAEKRVQRFLDAALELMSAAPDKEFTVQEVVEQSGQSLRSFYQHFTGKQELLLALFEDAIRSATEQLEALIAGDDDAVARLHRLVVEYYRMCRPSPSGKAAKALTSPMIEFAQELMTSQPAEASRAYVPLARLFERVLADAAVAGAVRNDIDVTGVLLQAISFNAFAMTIGGVHGRTADDAEQLWDLMFHGIGVQLR
jgi:AcrR family transcriptional regulator